MKLVWVKGLWNTMKFYSFWARVTYIQSMYPSVVILFIFLLLQLFPKCREMRTWYRSSIYGWDIHSLLFSACWPSGSFYINCHKLQEEDSLIRVEKFTYLYYKDKSLSISLILSQFNKIIVIAYFSRACNLSFLIFTVPLIMPGICPHDWHNMPDQWLLYLSEF